MAKKLKTYQSAGAVRDSINNAKYLKYKAISDSTIKAMRADTIPTGRNTSYKKDDTIHITGKSGSKFAIKPTVVSKKKGGQTNTKKK